VSHRLFIAIVPPQEVQRAIGEAARAVQAALGDGSTRDIKWVPDENVHATLKFLGETDEAKIEPIQRAIEAIASDWQPFAIQPTGIGCFPNERRPAVVWIGLTEGTDHLRRLADEVETEMDPLGFVPERKPYRGHLTIGRVRKDVRISGLAEALTAAGDAAERIPEFQASEIALMKSVLDRGGAVYTRLSGAALG